jgi:DNA polymerase III subunit gamma/tau
MSYLVLARKYRPRTFDEIVGQETVTRTLRNAIAGGRLGHAFLLSGARGVGKTTTARIIAKALNCVRAEGPTAEPCLECDSCREIAEGGSLDVQEIDGASNNSVDNVRELRESARYNPARDRFKVWIIDEVHQLSSSAFNALLKTLEEPPPRVKFIFATTEYHKVPDTILSRCQQYDFRLIPTQGIAAYLREVAGREGITVSDTALGRIARAAEGSVRDALSLFDQVLSFSGSTVRDEDLVALLGLIDRELLLGVSRGVAQGDGLALLELVERLADYGADYRNFARELLLHFRELLLVKLAPAGSALLRDLTDDERARIEPIAADYSEEDLLRALDVVTKAEADLGRSGDPRVTLELALLKLAQLRKLVPMAELVARVERLAGGAPAAPASRTTAPTPRRPSLFDAPPSRPPAPASRPATTRKAEDPPPLPGPGQDGILAAIAGLAQARPSLLQPLRDARARQDGDTLVLEIAAGFAAMAELHLDEYRELAAKAAGRAVKLRVVSLAVPAEATAAEPSAKPAEKSRERLIEAAAKEPAIQEALDIFKGRVVDVRESSDEPIR